MSFKSKFFSAITLAFAFVAFSTFASAQETNTDKDQNSTQKQERREWRGKFGKRDGGMGKGFRGGGIMRGLRDLNLTDAQKEQIRTIVESNRPDQATMEEMRTLHQAKRDGTITTEQQDRLKALKQERRAKGEQIEQQILAVLTPEQRTQLEQKKAEMKKRWEERKQLRQQNKQNKQTEDKDN